MASDDDSVPVQSSENMAINNNYVNINNNYKPGRKFGLTGSRQSANAANRFDNRWADAQRAEGNRSWIHNTEDMLLSEQEMEDKYNTIRLAIRTDGLTLKERMQHHRSQRDIVESNLHAEVDLLQSSLLEVKMEDVGSSCHETLSKLSGQIEVIRQCGRLMSSSAESLGAVAYESRMSAAVKMLVLYVDHVKRKWEKEHHELDEIKRILTESGVNVAKCLNVLPQRQPQKTETSSSGNKRRASFPSSPYNRRLSLRPSSSPSISPMASASASTAASPSPAIEIFDQENAEVVVTTRPLSQMPIIEDVELQINVDTPTTPLAPDQLQALTTRRRARTGKSHSWSSGLSQPMKATKVDVGVAMHIRKWTLGVVGWCRVQRIPACLTEFVKRDNWNMQQIALLLRLTAIGCLVAGALFSLVATFLPSTPFL